MEGWTHEQYAQKLETELRELKAQLDGKDKAIDGLGIQVVRLKGEVEEKEQAIETLNRNVRLSLLEIRELFRDKAVAITKLLNDLCSECHGEGLHVVESIVCGTCNGTGKSVEKRS